MLDITFTPLPISAGEPDLCTHRMEGWVGAKATLAAPDMEHNSQYI
jgi:hypothetical protein